MRTLTRQDIEFRAPSVFATAPASDVSELYEFIPTWNIVERLAKDNWLPHDVREQRVRTPLYKGHQKHMLRFVNQDVKVGDDFISLILTNSHNRTARFSFSLGLWRLICSNGLMTGSVWEQAETRHIGPSVDWVVSEAYKILGQANQMERQIHQMKDCDLTPTQKIEFAKSAMRLRYDDLKDAPYTPEALLKTNRELDEGDSVWKVFNTVQENMTKGGVIGSRIVNGRNRRIVTLGLSSVDSLLKVNKELWKLAIEQLN